MLTKTEARKPPVLVEVGLVRSILSVLLAHFAISAALKHGNLMT
jgi:hypothetical protein